MKIAIIGAGAMGCMFGGQLSRCHDVTMLDSYGPQVEAINANGITLVESDESVHHFPNVRAAMSGSLTEHFDLVIVFVKSTFTADALAQNAALFQPETLVLTLQNGAGNDRKIEKYVAKENVIVGTCKTNAVNLGSGKTRRSGPGATTIGSNYSAHDQVETIRKAFDDCGIEVVVSDDIQRIIWSKLLVNLSINTFTAITETPIGYMLENEHAWNFAKRLVYEAIEVAEADGTYFDRREALGIVRDVCEKSRSGYSSMYQDRKKQIRTEIDAINGAIVEQAKLYGIPTPYNTLIVDLIHAIEGAYQYHK